MSTIDTSTWSPDTDLNASIEGIPLNADASIAQTWQAIRILMAAFKGDTSAIEAFLVPFAGATSQADGTQGLVPAPEAGEEDKVLRGDGTWGSAGEASSVAWSGVTGKPSSFTPSSHTHGSITNDGKLDTASRAVVTDGDKKIAVSSVTSTELGYLSGVTSALQTQLNAKAADSGVVHTSGNETVGGEKTFTGKIVAKSDILPDSDSTNLMIRGGTDGTSSALTLSGKSYSSTPGYFRLFARTTSTTATRLEGRPDGTLTWNGNSVQTTSDERLKTPLSAVPDEVLNAWEDVQWGQFQLLDAVERKGKAARLHLGLIAQRVKAIFEERGLDACRYGILCYEKEEDLWMVRYTEALAMEAACQRRRADRLEARIAALEAAVKKEASDEHRIGV